jgi:hypothetical protein
VHAEAATTAEYVPAGHVWHAEAEEAPTSAECVPLVQSVHVNDPAVHKRTHAHVGLDDVTPWNKVYTCVHVLVHYTYILS